MHADKETCSRCTYLFDPCTDQGCCETSSRGWGRGVVPEGGGMPPPHPHTHTQIPSTPKFPPPPTTKIMLNVKQNGQRKICAPIRQRKASHAVPPLEEKKVLATPPGWGILLMFWVYGHDGRYDLCTLNVFVYLEPNNVRNYIFRNRYMKGMCTVITFDWNSFYYVLLEFHVKCCVDFIVWNEICVLQTKWDYIYRGI